ncbi:ABC transporter permease [Streptomyces heilongjiangensis]|uniref:ABC transporter permease n=1 Tax=Streptomyces heilongjiangensis TaxID=945052 RepID=A0ABW1BCW7_9ACTN|nr:ABC transporter permease [Streptomyces heilongjiangensis]MDC2950535.1 ABC transporter permease [Streptomyces heilongjiangensis]
MATPTGRDPAPALVSLTGRMRARGRGRGSIMLLQLSAVLIVLALWALIAATGLVSPTALPGPGAVFTTFPELVAGEAYWQAVADTLRGAVTGYAAAVVIGVPLGLATGTYAVAEQSTRLLVDVLRSFPVIALLPVFLLVMGSTPSMKATVVFIACVFPVFLQAQYGARAVTPMIAETVHSYRIPRLLSFRKVVLPSATPSIMTGLRLAATTSVLVAIGVEVLTTLPGIGHQVVQDQQGGASASAYAYILTAGLIGYSINQLSQLVESRLLRWRPPAHTD